MLTAAAWDELLNERLAHRGLADFGELAAARRFDINAYRGCFPT